MYLLNADECDQTFESHKSNQEDQQENKYIGGKNDNDINTITNNYFMPKY